MGDQLKKVRSGDPLNIPAQTFNTFIDAARDFREHQTGQSRKAQGGYRQSGIVLVKNNSGADRDRFQILGIDSPIFTPTDNLDSFKNKVALQGVVPTTSHQGKFAILLEPLKTGAIGMALASGICPVKIDIINEDHRFTDVNSSTTESLKSVASGSAFILWKETGTGEKWAVVKLGIASDLGTHATPKILGGSGEDADSESWDIDDQPSGYDGVKWKAFRLYWSGTSGDPIYQFIRTPTHDSMGRLVAVSTENRSIAFGTDTCEE